MAPRRHAAPIQALQPPAMSATLARTFGLCPTAKSAPAGRRKALHTANSSRRQPTERGCSSFDRCRCPSLALAAASSSVRKGLSNVGQQAGEAIGTGEVGHRNEEASEVAAAIQEHTQSHQTAFAERQLRVGAAAMAAAVVRMSLLTHVETGDLMST